MPSSLGHGIQLLIQELRGASEAHARSPGQARRSPGQPLRDGRCTQPHPMWPEVPVSMRRSIREEAAPCPPCCVPLDTQEPLGGASPSPVNTPILWVGPGWARVPQPPLKASSPRSMPVAGRSQLCPWQRGACLLWVTCTPPVHPPLAGDCAASCFTGLSLSKGWSVCSRGSVCSQHKGSDPPSRFSHLQNGISKAGLSGRRRGPERGRDSALSSTVALWVQG